jgi:hypothetical protein
MKARISPKSPRYKDWLFVFGRDTVPILEPPYERADGNIRMLVDIRDMPADVIRRLAVKYSKSRRMPADRMLEEMRATGSVVVSAVDVEVIEEAGRLF